MVSYGLFLIGIGILKKDLRMITKGTGEIHKRLVQNQCPKCAQKLKVIKKDAKILVRFCGICNLTITDQIENAEYPEDVCD